MAVADDSRLRKYQALLAPGTSLRDGLERILHGRTGALIVLGNSKAVLNASSGGFDIDVEFTPQALRELSKLDGGIIMSTDLDRIVRAGVHFVPDGSLPTPETGTRHRSADRMAQQTGVPVVTVSASMSTIALFLEGERHAVEKPEQIISRANQALSAHASYRQRLNQLTTQLTSLEVADEVTVRDVTLVAQRLAMLRRLATELSGYVTALGIEGRLLELQLREQNQGLDDLADALAEDYRPQESDAPFGWAGLSGLHTDGLFDVIEVARVFGFTSEQLDSPITPRGYRQLSAIPRLPQVLVNRVIDHFGSLQALIGATIPELLEVDGIGEQRARLIREGLLRMAEGALQDVRRS
ncbi:DNA integrity scanning diadenylate cyclase DisA [Aestuariimicrobium soli]|uniref:DNA integrity scanning diadenylate cyclase DisA n=1 Tax=Aestuariimicrobium soli TaxID=2035834 RepID=UPI003EBCE5B0